MDHNLGANFSAVTMENDDSYAAVAMTPEYYSMKLLIYC